VKVGDQVVTPVGAGTVSGFKTVTVWDMKGPRDRQMVMVKLPGRRPHPWFPDKLRPL
jgi:predicted HAD superfamily phosphohydrolase YqeG